VILTAVQGLRLSSEDQGNVAAEQPRLPCLDLPSRLYGVNAVKIIDAIKHLPPREQDEVVCFVRSLEAGRPWTPAQLKKRAEALAAASDADEARELKERIAAGFYGDERHA
jgi:hypothetical protein